MTCTPALTLKQGDTLSIALQLFDQDTGQAVPLTPIIQVAARLNDRFGHAICDLVYAPYPDQSDVANTGWFLLTTPPGTDTSTWKAGVATWDIKLTQDGIVKRTHSQQIQIISSVTP